MWRTSIDTIGQAGLGHSFGSIDAKETNAYIETIKHILWVQLRCDLGQTIAYIYGIVPSPTLQKLGLVTLFLPVLLEIGTPGFRRKIVEIFPWKVVQDYKRQVDILNRHSHDVLSKRRSALIAEESTTFEASGRGKDTMTLLRACHFKLVSHKSHQNSACLQFEQMRPKSPKTVYRRRKSSHR